MGHSHRLQNATIHIADSEDMTSNKQLCASFQKITTENQIENFKCTASLIGRYVRLSLHTDNILTVCEMQVWGYFI